MFDLSRRAFSDLSEQEVLALAISSEEEDMRIYASYAEGCAPTFPPPRRCSPTWRPRNRATARG
ncbi:hypothetical protein A6302_01340 [Methylobrevis pamukkalensis]|uniref:Rubrerythrin n=1 Tax=Methylobrevis pamukkalensis TaxID=1439726 RepID=A0A1E3H4R2_9HYPH|nr:hypothetical protein A6302_01340 [Methylobrevis pamukkalensis]